MQKNTYPTQTFSQVQVSDHSSHKGQGWHDAKPAFGLYEMPEAYSPSTSLEAY